MPREKPEPRTISSDDHLRMVGLITVGTDLRAQVDRVENSLGKLLEGEPDEYGHYDWAGELLWGGRSLGEILKILNITVQDN